MSKHSICYQIWTKTGKKTGKTNRNNKKGTTNDRFRILTPDLDNMPPD